MTLSPAKSKNINEATRAERALLLVDARFWPGPFANTVEAVEARDEAAQDGRRPPSASTSAAAASKSPNKTSVWTTGSSDPKRKLTQRGGFSSGILASIVATWRERDHLYLKRRCHNVMANEVMVTNANQTITRLNLRIRLA